MQTIYKYILQITDTQTVKMPAGAQILTVQTQHEQVTVWAFVDTSKDLVERVFDIIGTGHPAVGEGFKHKYIGTCQMMKGLLVWHVFERLGDN